jgi:hypothetical protein
VTDYAQRFDSLRKRFSERDQRMREVALVRAGHADQVFPGLFPEGNWSRPIIANLIDVVARDFAEQAGVIPTLTASGDSALEESQRSKADKRTKIANFYVASSKLATQMIRAADQFATYGFVPLRVEPHFKENRPHIHVEHAMGAYYDIDRFGRVNLYCHVFQRKAGDLAAMFPEQADQILKRGAFGASQDANQMLEVVRWYDMNNTAMFVPERQGLLLAQSRNLLGRVPVAIAMRNSLDGEARGQFDDVLPVFAAKARLALLTMEAVQKSVEAPLALPQDVTQLTVGPDAIIRSNSPEKIRRVPIEVPQYAFAENNVLSEELRLGTRFPESRAGQPEGSIVTGQGIKALQAGFDGQIKTAQSILGEALGEAVSLALATDELYFPDLKKEVSGAANGVPFRLEYTPSKDIDGKYGMNVEYGLMAGLDPNRALVFALQARGDKLLSRNFVRRNLPVTLNSSEEERAIDMEEMRDSLKAGVAALAAAIPQMASQGQDPTQIIEKMATVIAERKKGTPLEDAVAKAFEPPKPEPEEQQPDPSDLLQQLGGTEDPEAAAAMAAREGSGAPAPQGGPGPGMDNPMQQGPPPMQQLLAGLTGAGNPVLAGRVVRQVPA